MKVSKDGFGIHAEVVSHVRHKGNNFYVLKYITEEGGPTYLIEMPVTMQNRHLEAGNEIELQLLMAKG